MPAPLLALTTPDGIVLALMGYFALRGFLKGFVWQLLRTGGLLMGFGLAAHYDVAVGSFLAHRFSFVPEAASDLVGWAVIVVGTFLVVTLLATLLREAVREASLSGTDRVLGLALGAVLGLGIAAFGFTLWASMKPESEVKKTLAGSRTIEWMAKLVETVKPLFPDGVRERWEPVLKSFS